MNYTFNNQFKLAAQRFITGTADANDRLVLMRAVDALPVLSIASVVVLNHCDDGTLSPKILAAETAIATLRGALADMDYVPYRAGTPSFVPGRKTVEVDHAAYSAELYEQSSERAARLIKE